MAARFGALYSRAGNGISHWAHMERFDVPGQAMLGCDSHTCQAGAVGMLGIGAGGFEVAAVMAGGPYFFPMPPIVPGGPTREMAARGSPEGVILEMLHRFGEKWGKEKVVEYVGAGIKGFSVPERGTIANMGAELGATGSLFPSDAATERFFRGQKRSDDYRPMAADDKAEYDDR